MTTVTALIEALDIMRRDLGDDAEVVVRIFRPNGPLSTLAGEELLVSARDCVVIVEGDA